MSGPLRLRWVTAVEAARLLGITEVAVRKRVASGSLHGIRAGRGWRVLLAGAPSQSESRAEMTERPEQPERADAHEASKVLAQTSESLVTLVRDLQRHSLALAGQIGYLQSQLVQAQQEMTRLTDRQDATIPDGSAAAGVNRQEHEAALQTIAELRQVLHDRGQEAAATTAPRPRSRWRFWRRRA